MSAHAIAGVKPAEEFKDLPEAEETLQRIGDVARQFGVSLRTLRFYEDKGLIAPKRDGTTRLYSRRDLGRLKLIMLGRRVGFSLREVKQIIDLYDPAGTNLRQLKLAADKSEKQIGKLQKQRQQIDSAIGELTELLNQIRQDLATASAARVSGANAPANDQ